MKTHKVRPVLVEIKFNLIEEMQGDIILRGNKLYTCKQLNTLQLHKKESNDKVFELILISLEDEKIDVGDLYIMDEFLMNPVKDENEADRCNNNPSITPFCKKVIARQSQISPEYISKFIEQYNNDCVEDFEIEMITMNKGYNDIADIPYKEVDIPKITNGFVIIVEKKPISYTEEEVNKLLHKFLDIQEGLNTYQRHASLDTWFEQNKKK